MQLKIKAGSLLVLDFISVILLVLCTNFTK